MKILHRLVAFLLLPVLGYLLGATIFFTFWDRIDVGDPAKAGYVAVAESCERRGPVSYKGFGHWYTCTAKVTQLADGVTRTMKAGFLTPEHIGREVAVETTRRYREITASERPYTWLAGVLLFPYFILWLFVFVHVAGPVLPVRRRGRKMPIRYQKPGTES
ncbi:hypothetical protein JOF41_004979 [Saccharothrix coeruleofusca]|uniref:DUF6346 domain-containing protein n=1 Tax=Saccharothrix coeruleofusca TaxID=33919 RepID=UPI001AE257CB|nr:DUF6346 domain-containing protein [Saccharothrix coeruleofusca]MBP2338801.1 hypothetical protein [Saccharothrix coeruleofusca]